MTMTSHNRSAYTLTEILVALAILVVVVGLAVVGVGKVRERGRRVQCVGNLQTMGLALHSHHQLKRVFPSNGGWDGKQMILSKAGVKTTVSSTEAYQGLTFTYGVGEPFRAPAEQGGSWAYAILPNLNQGNIQANADYAAAVPAFVCPARRGAIIMPAVNDQYGTYEGGGWEWAHIDYAANALMIPNRPVCRTLGHITDGLANTILLGEKPMDPAMYATGTWYWDEPYFVGGSGGTQRGFGTTGDEGKLIVQDAVSSMGLFFRYNWGSAHPDGAHFLFADGSVRMLVYGTDPAVVGALLTPAGGDASPGDGS